MIDLSKIQKINKELVAKDGRLLQVEVNLLEFHQIDIDVKLKLLDSYLADKKAQAGLELMGVDISKRLEQFGICQYGGMDELPDFTPTQTNQEWFDCGHRGKCPGEGLVCKSIITPLGRISPRMIQYITLAAKGWYDNDIAEKMGVSSTTVSSYRVHCLAVLELENKSALVAWAKDKNIA